MVVLRLPDVGEGIAEGEVIKFLVKEGDVVEKYQPLVEVMTVKVTVEIPSPVKGVVKKILASPGQVLKVGDAFIEISTDEPYEEKVEEKPPAPMKETVAEFREKSRILATPAVKKLAKELGVDLASLVGTGPEGRITEEDVRKAAAWAEQRIPIRGLRRIIADRLVQAKSKAALVTVFENVDAGELVKLRDELRGLQDEKNVKMTYLPLVMKAIVAAVREVPMMNGWIDEERNEIVLSKAVNIGIAVDTPDGLLVPIIKNVEKKDVWTLAREVEEVAEKARQGRLSLEDVRGGTISISNYGSLGSLSGTPIVNFPEIAIVGVGRIEKRPVVKDDSIVVGHVLELAVTMDHRAVDGGTMAKFVNALRRNLENIRQVAEV
ncbi:MAG: 2-oxo acid dehydrogenase subunit E2 [Candidatus Caldarchaeum sp.]|nr:2-oxo acid dehydrogenase subunit E2 [Candidatus Caldarchaeum sp.]MDW8435733.1 dihydrolipoamide acetyltransferase family protein [Candidatus Caldarchaeum sp.]